MDRSKFERMLVWDNHESEAKERIVIAKFDDFCVTVLLNEEIDFLDGDFIEAFICYRHYKPIPKKPKKPKKAEFKLTFEYTTPDEFKVHLSREGELIKILLCSEENKEVLYSNIDSFIQEELNK